MAVMDRTEPMEPRAIPGSPAHSYLLRIFSPAVPEAVGARRVPTGWPVVKAVAEGEGAREDPVIMTSGRAMLSVSILRASTTSTGQVGTEEREAPVEKADKAEM